MVYFLLIFISFQLSYASDVDKLISESWSQDPLLLSQQKKIDAAQIDQFARFLPNSPTLTFADSDNHSWRTYGVNLPFAFPGKSFAYHRLDRLKVSAEVRELSAKKIELAKFIFGLYSDCASKKELSSILSTAVKELGILKEAITARYEMGQATQAERIGIELQYRQASIENLTLQDQQKVACTKLNDYKNEKSLQTELKDSGLPSDFDPTFLDELGESSLEFIRAENEQKISALNAELSSWSIAPDINLTYYRNYYNRVVASPIVPVKWTNTYMVSVNLPILYPFYERSEFFKLRAENMINSERAKMRLIEVEKEILNAQDTFRRSRKIYDKLMRQDLPMAEAMVDSTLAAYRQGKLGFSELILSKRTWLDLKKEEVDLKLKILSARLVCLKNCERN